jgi:hypothetical protein
MDGGSEMSRKGYETDLKPRNHTPEIVISQLVFPQVENIVGINGSNQLSTHAGRRERCDEADQAREKTVKDR